MSRGRAGRGRGLIEFVVAATLAALLIAGAWTLYIQTERHGRSGVTVSRAEDTLRAGFAAIEPELRMAGAWGLTARSSFITGAAGAGDPPGAIDASVARDCGPNFVADLNQPVAARARYDLDCAGLRPAAWAGVLIVRRAGVAVRALEGGRVQLTATRLGGALSADGSFPREFDPAGAETHDLAVSAYYVGEDAGVRGERQWTLRRQTLTRGRAGRPAMVDEALVPGIVDLQVLLGVDTDGDDAVDVYVRPGAPELAHGRVLSVRLALTAFADAGAAGADAGGARDGPPPDGRGRVTLERTVALRNASAR